MQTCKWQLSHCHDSLLESIWKRNRHVWEDQLSKFSLHPPCIRFYGYDWSIFGLRMKFRCLIGNGCNNACIQLLSCPFSYENRREIHHTVLIFINLPPRLRPFESVHIAPMTLGAVILKEEERINYFTKIFMVGMHSFMAASEFGRGYMAGCTISP